MDCLKEIEVYFFSKFTFSKKITENENEIKKLKNVIGLLKNEVKNLEEKTKVSFIEIESKNKTK